jgi:hypothetical protein
MGRKGEKLWTGDACDSKQGPSGSCEHDNESSCSIKDGEFLDLLSDCQLLKKDCASWIELVEFML